MMITVRIDNIENKTTDTKKGPEFSLGPLFLIEY